jgi:hypothetical protein
MVSFCVVILIVICYAPLSRNDNKCQSGFFLSEACNVKWLGLRGDDLQLIPEESLVSLKPRDLQIAKSLMSSETLQVC